MYSEAVVLPIIGFRHAAGYGLADFRLECKTRIIALRIWMIVRVCEGFGVGLLYLCSDVSVNTILQPPSTLEIEKAVTM